MKDRYMTEDEHIKLVELGNQFDEDLAAAAAKVFKQLPPEIDVHVKYYLQDRTSLFSPRTADLIDKLLGRRTNA